MDRRILAALQADAGLSMADLAARVGLSPTPCWRRVQKLQAAGVIRKRVALLDRAALNCAVTVFVAVRTNRHEPGWLADFAAAVNDFDEVVEFHRLSGDWDYLLKVTVPDIAAYDAFYKRLTARVALSDVTSMFAMEEIKATTELPLGFVG